MNTIINGAAWLRILHCKRRSGILVLANSNRTLPTGEGHGIGAGIRQLRLYSHLFKQGAHFSHTNKPYHLISTRCSSSIIHHERTETRRYYSKFVDRRPSRLILGKHVKEAMANGSPIVALESTVITHGLPEPLNFDLALSLERVVANWDQTITTAQHDPANSRHLSPSSSSVFATPATVGIVRGQLIVGLSQDEIKYLAQRELSKPIKASRRDIPIAMGLGLSAGTTVSATMAIASSIIINRAGGRPHKYPGESLIKVFATGGLGGVHMGGELSMDISADLYEFARSPIGVVSSGFKSFLDARRSLEFLETMGATVMSLEEEDPEGRPSNSDMGGLFPGFFTRKNKENIKSPYIVRSIEEAALVLFECLEGPLASRHASLLAVPIPIGSTNRANHSPRMEKLRLEGTQNDHSRLDQSQVGEEKLGDDDDDVDANLDLALLRISDEVDKRLDLEGKEKTPLILKRLEEVTGGRSLRANIELLRNNALVGAKLAVKLAELTNRTGAILETGFQESFAQRGRQAHYNDDDEKDTFKGVSTRKEEKEANFFEAERPEEASPCDDNHGPVVVGCTMIDMHVSTKIDHHFKNNSNRSGITFQGWPHLTLGGVGQNLATALQFLGHKPTFITSLGSDNLAQFALDQLRKNSTLPTKRLVVYTFGQQQNEEQDPTIELRPNASGAGCCSLHVNRSNPTQKKSQTSTTTTTTTTTSSSSPSPSPSPSSSCFALVLMDSADGLCEYVIANLEAIKAIDEEAIKLCEPKIKRAPLLVLDANLMPETIGKLLEICHISKVPIFIEPTDKLALPHLVDCLSRFKLNDKCSTLNSLLCLSPNILELEAMVELFENSNGNNKKTNQLNNKQESSSSKPPLSQQQQQQQHLEQMAHKLMSVYLPQLKCLLVTKDKDGVLVAVRSNGNKRGVSLENINLLEEFREQQEQTTCHDTSSSILMRHFEPPRLVKKPVSASGAGDSFAAGFISGLLDNLTLNHCLSRAFEASLMALEDRDTISRKLRGLSRGVNLEQTSNQGQKN